MITYPALDFARDYFNRKLFGGELRPCLITVQRRRTACGFFAPAKFRSHDHSDVADEIGLDPRYWGPPRTDTENLSVLVHEMVHLWQHHCGRKRSRGGYHNREFARKMFEVGLITSDTGERGGKPIGTRMSHYIASKMGIIGFMRGLANDVANDGITANAVLPGLTNTLAIAPQSKEQKRAIWEQQAIKRLGEPRDLTGAVLFLTSDDAAFITGQAIVVDGGQYRIG